MSHPLGIDIGGSGIKGAPVDLERGTFAAERVRLATPKKSTPKKVIELVAEIAEHFEDQCAGQPVGVDIPGIVRHGIVHSAANIHKQWIGFDAEAALSERLGRPVTAINDADAAGVAELRYGAGRDASGTIMVLTLGTGIGSALLVDGTLVPNTELGHLELDGHDAETRASSAAREREDLSWGKWAARLDRYLLHVEALFSPDLFVLGGGDSKRTERFVPLLTVKTPIRPSELRNDGGIIGAAWQAAHAAR